MGPFQRDYLAGRTPLPCARCNPTVKFPALFRRAEEVGADWVATGHYARIAAGPAGEPLLCRGAHTNDQAYMLAGCPNTGCPAWCFPSAGMKRPRFGSWPGTLDCRWRRNRTAWKSVSFRTATTPPGWRPRRGAAAGPFCGPDPARVLGRHRGIHRYTIGQRRGLGIPAAHRLFVSEIRPETQEVVLSDGTDLMADTVWGEDFNPLAPLTEGEELTVRLRHSKTETPARFYPEGTGGRLELLTPARAPTPGQLAVLYRGDWVLGSLWITRARRIPG